MSLWIVLFYPKSGDKHSPADYINNIIPRPADRASIVDWLIKLSEREIGDWPNTRIHKITHDIWQLTVGNYRVSFVLDSRFIVVLHCCRKRGQRTHTKDKRRAELNYESYLASKE